MLPFLMELMESLDSRRAREALPYNALSFKQFEPLLINPRLSLSIQAGYALYSTPRLTLDDLEGYTAMEIALLEKDNFTRFQEVIPAFDRLKEIEDHWEGSVYSFVPVDLIQAALDELRAVQVHGGK